MRDHDKLITETYVLGGQVTARPQAAPAAPRAHADPAQVHETIAKLVKALDAHRPQIELLYEACRRARLTIPGIRAVALRHPRTPKGDEVVIYVTRKAGGEPPFARTVQVGVFRYYDAEEGARSAAEAIETPPFPALKLSHLRLKHHHLVHLHVDFKGDPVLRQLFPGPKTLPPPPPMSTAQRMKAKMKFEGALRRAEGLLVALEREMGAVRQVNAHLARRGGPDMLALTRGREERDTCLIALGVERDAVARKLLNDAVRDFAALEAGVAKARASQDPTGLEALAAPLAGFRHACQAHPFLQKLFPAAEAAAS